MAGRGREGQRGLPKEEWKWNCGLCGRVGERGTRLLSAAGDEARVVVKRSHRTALSFDTTETLKMLGVRSGKCTVVLPSPMLIVIVVRKSLDL